MADLLLRGVDKRGWNTELYERNALQARRPATAKRISLLLRARLRLMQPPLWTMIRDGSALVATHACLAAAIKHSALLGDFLDSVVREQYRLFSPALSNRLWDDYIETCGNRDPDVLRWHESTVKRLRSSVFQMLAQAGYIGSTRTLKLQPAYIAREVLEYLQAYDEQYVLRCIQVAP